METVSEGGGGGGERDGMLPLPPHKESLDTELDFWLIAVIVIYTLSPVTYIFQPTSKPINSSSFLVGLTVSHSQL